MAGEQRGGRARRPEHPSLKVHGRVGGGRAGGRTRAVGTSRKCKGVLAWELSVLRFSDGFKAGFGWDKVGLRVGWFEIAGRG